MFKNFSFVNCCIDWVFSHFMLHILQCFQSFRQQLVPFDFLHSEFIIESSDVLVESFSQNGLRWPYFLVHFINLAKHLKVLFIGIRHAFLVHIACYQRVLTRNVHQGFGWTVHESRQPLMVSTDEGSSTRQRSLQLICSSLYFVPSYPVPHFLYLCDLVIFAVLNICQNVRARLVQSKDNGPFSDSSDQTVLDLPFWQSLVILRWLRGSWRVDRLFLVGWGRWQTFECTVDLSLLFDIFWWSVTFDKSFEFLIRFCLILRRDTKFVGDIKLVLLLVGFMLATIKLILRHVDFLVAAFWSPEMHLVHLFIFFVLHVRFWNRVRDWLDKELYVSTI